MTEAEWLAGDDATLLWEGVKDHARWTPRTMRLFVSAFWGWQAKRLRGNARAELQRMVAGFEKWAETGKLAHRYRATDSPDIIFFNTSPSTAVATTISAPKPHWGRGWEVCPGVMAGFLRDIFGNPFRPVECEPSWLTSTVVQLARGIYADRAFDRLPILADALQDAGCEYPDVLEHCKSGGPHVRGCWVVDLLLGKA